MAFRRRGTKTYRVLDSAAFPSHMDREIAASKRILKQQFKHLTGLTVQTAQRNVKAFNACERITVIVARQRTDNLTDVGLKASGLPVPERAPQQREVRDSDFTQAEP